VRTSGYSVGAQRTIRVRRRQAGIALLISIFILLLISVVAIALIVASGTETSLAGNYRSATGVYYAALSGLEEARGRLSTKNVNSFKNTAPGFLPTPGIPLAIGNASYVLNPGPTETMGNILTTYPDNEFATEFGAAPSNVQTTASIWNRSPLNALNLPGPLYKWVRINAVSEQSLQLDVDFDGSKDNNPLYYNGTQFTITAAGAQQVFEITSLAVLPNGSQKLVQYLAAPVPIYIPNFSAALTIVASVIRGVAYSAPILNSSYYASGNDLTGIPGCTAGPPVHAMGTLDSTDVANIIGGGNGGTGIPSAYRFLYTGAAATPDVADVSGSYPSSLRTPSGLNAFVQTIIQNADVTINGSAGGSNLTPLGMTSSNPLTVVINGDLDLNGWHNTGYGLLLVTGNLDYDPDASWQGIIMVIGKGTVTGSHSGSGEIDGAFFVAQTLDPSTGYSTLLPDPNLGKATVMFSNNMGGVGTRYSSCWIQKSIPGGNYKILSFHEIAQ
jgi:hypothetical protein